MKRGVKTIIVIIFILNFTSIGMACTGFTAYDDKNVLAGMNEDNYSTRRYIEIYPPEDGKFGRIFFGYEGYYIQQMINDQGLLWDGFWAPHLDVQNGAGKPRPNTWIDDWMEVCSTVDEVIDIYNSYDWRNTGIEDAMLFFVDRQGNSAIIEGDDIIFKEESHQAVTNFYQTHPELGGFGFDRYETAINMLGNMNDFSMVYFKDICSATSQSSTIYSIVCNLTSNLIHYYYARDFDNVWEIDLNEEFEFGFQTYDVLDVFNNYNPDKPNNPVGLNNCNEYSICEYSCQTTDNNNDQLYYKWNFGDGTISNWIGPFNSGETCMISHQWNDIGEYQVKVIARDENCGKSEWSDPLDVQVIDSDNNRPDKPLTPSGPSNGKIGEEHTYTTLTVDPDDDQLYYMWDLGDGTLSDWIGSYSSGEECSISHTWESHGNYEIKVKARDSYNFESDWSDSLAVTIPKFKNVHFPIINFILQKLSFFYSLINKIVRGSQ
jgi:hypothetical protein